MFSTAGNMHRPCRAPMGEASRAISEWLQASGMCIATCGYIRAWLARFRAAVTAADDMRPPGLARMRCQRRRLEYAMPCAPQRLTDGRGAARPPEFGRMRARSMQRVIVTSSDRSSAQRMCVRAPALNSV